MSDSRSTGRQNAGSDSAPSISAAGEPVHPSEAFPRAFGDYLLLSSFGRGGMGEVYLAKRGRIEGIEQLCVLKRLRDDLGKEQEYVRRFIDEARLVVQLGHANICHVFDVGKVGSDHYLAMEYIPGLNLRAVTDRLDDEGRALGRGLALHLVAEVLDALDYAHRKEDPATGESIRLVHRDVSPHNVMVSFEGEVKLIDFGLAASELKDEKTESHLVMGKVAYMSPEQARGDEVCAATDQFAAAIILYELLSGRRFYGERRLHEIWQIVGVGGYLPDDIDQLPAGLPAILKRALAPWPRDRFETCEAFREAVVEVLHQEQPLPGKRQVRELMQELFVEEIGQHRAVLRQYQDLSASTIRRATEATMSFASRSTPAADLDGPALPPDSGSLPTGVVPAAKKDDPRYRSITEETATATAFASGPPPAPAEQTGSSALVQVGAKVVSRGALAAGLVGIGVIATLIYSGASAEPATPPAAQGIPSAPGDHEPAEPTDAPPLVSPPPEPTAAPTGTAPGEAAPDEAAAAEPPAVEPAPPEPPAPPARRRKVEVRRKTTKSQPSKTEPAPKPPSSVADAIASSDVEDAPLATPFVEEDQAGEGATAAQEPPPSDKDEERPPPKPEPADQTEAPEPADEQVSIAELRRRVRILEEARIFCTKSFEQAGVTPTCSDETMRKGEPFIQRCWSLYNGE